MIDRISRKYERLRTMIERLASAIERLRENNERLHEYNERTSDCPLYKQNKQKHLHRHKWQCRCFIRLSIHIDRVIANHDSARLGLASNVQRFFRCVLNILAEADRTVQELFLFFHT